MENTRIYAEINLENIRKNIQSVREIVTPNVKIMAVIKADGYGHGAIQCADATRNFADAYAVATIDEALELRYSGVDKEILVLGYIFPNQYEKAIANDISITVFNLQSAKDISDVAVRLGKDAIIHIAVDTGMGRIGFIPCDESVDAIIELSEYPHLIIEGIFSHFATADEKDKEYSYNQLKKFRHFISKLDEHNVKINTIHIDNSAAVTELPDSHFDMVRIGIILYGLYPSCDVDRGKIKLYPAMSLKSSVVNVKTIKSGDCVSYGCHFLAKKDTCVATVSVGYADGYPRLLSNKGRVIVNGKYAPVIGNVCMDQIMIDVTEIDDVEIGTDVILLGKQGDAEITADEIASFAETINYEIVCGVSKRVPRIYIG